MMIHYLGSPAFTETRNSRVRWSFPGFKKAALFCALLSTLLTVHTGCVPLCQIDRPLSADASEEARRNRLYLETSERHSARAADPSSTASEEEPGATLR